MMGGMEAEMKSDGGLFGSNAERHTGVIAKRPCHLADALRRQSDKKQNLSSDARIAKLEGTLGQLVSLLLAGNPLVGEMTNVQSSPLQQQPRTNVEIVDHHQPSTLIPTPPILPYQDVTAEGTDGSGSLEDTRAGAQPMMPLQLASTPSGRNSCTSSPLFICPPTSRPSSCGDTGRSYSVPSSA